MAGYQGIDLSGGNIAIDSDGKSARVSGKVSTDKVTSSEELMIELKRQFGKDSTINFEFRAVAGGFYIRTGPTGGLWPDEEPVYDEKGNIL